MAKLHDGMRFDARPVRIRQADRLHRPVAQRVASPLGHDLDGKATFEIGRGLEVLERRLLGGEERVDEGLVLSLVERTVDVVGAAAAGPGFVVARLAPAHVHVDRLEMNDRRDRIEEGELRLAGERLDRACQRGRGEGAGRHDDAVPVGRRQAGDLTAVDLDQGMRGERRRHGAGEAFTVDRKRAARRELVAVGRSHDQRAGAAHLLMQQADGVGLPLVGAERVGADELCERVGLMRLGLLDRAHLVERDRHALLHELPSRLASGETAADDVHPVGHGGT